MTSILHYLEDSAARNPQKIAISDIDNCVSFGELLQLTNVIGTALIRTLNKVNSPVVVLIERNVESICAFMGIVASRNFYVPVDTDMPLQRILAIVDQMQPSAVISTGNVPEALSDKLNVPILNYSDLIQWKADPILLASVRETCLDIDPLYAMCTSGSTGTPKAVLASHRCVMDFISTFTKTFHLTENDVFGNQAPFDFDASCKDIYSTLLLGASMFIIPKVCFAMPKKLVEVLDERRITTLVWTVSAVCIAAGVNAFKHRVPACIQKVLFSGEVMPIKMLNVWRSYYPNAMFVNLYGPTETTCNCTYYIVDREFQNTETLPIGVPFSNEGVYVLNEENRPISAGETGEVYVSGTTLALGYYRNPEKTNEVFIQNPANTSYPELVYRTGDLVELREDGYYYFVARKDFQIKHMGHRIELEEIEMYINAMDGITRTCCLFDENRNKIVAFYVGEVEKADIVKSLKLDLPKYMIPNIFIQKENLPMNQHGKIDRKALRASYMEAEGVSPAE